MADQHRDGAEDPPPAQAELGRSARRGLVFISAAKLWFMVAGLAIQLLLPRALGSPALFGVWTLVLAWVSTLNNVVVTATIQSVAYFAAGGAAATEAAKRTALRMQLLVGGGLTLALVLGAPLISDFQHDVTLTPLLRLSAVVLLSYSFYAVFVGAANGARHFHKQAGLDITFSTLRASLVISGAVLTHQVLGAVAGFASAAVIITLASVVVVGLPRGGAAADLGVAKMLRYSLWLTLYLIAINLLMFLDGFLLKRLATESLLALSQDGAAAKPRVDALVGIYGAVQTVARLPYQLILAGAFVIFPVMSATALEQDPSKTSRYIAITLRYSLLGSVALVVGLAVRPEATMRLLYPADYAQGGAALGVLLLGYLCFSLLTIVGTILNGVGRTGASTALGLGTLALTATSVLLCLRLGLSRHPEGGPAVLLMAAAGMTAGVAAGLAAALTYLWWRFGAVLRPRTLASVALSAAAALGLSRFWPAAGGVGFAGSKLGTLCCAALAVLVYLILNILTHELSPREVLAQRRVR